MRILSIPVLPNLISVVETLKKGMEKMFEWFSSTPINIT